VPTLAVCLIYSLWSAWRRERQRRDARLRQRVAYLLWVAAQQL
jgi:hypothetical protein